MCDRDDLESEILLRLWSIPPGASFPPGAPTLGQWLHGVARNVAQKIRNAARGGHEVGPDEAEPICGSGDRLGKDEMMAFVGRALRKLPSPFREVMTCRLVEDQSRKEVVARGCAAWRLSETRVRAILREGCQRVRRPYRITDPEEFFSRKSNRSGDPNTYGSGSMS